MKDISVSARRALLEQNGDFAIAYSVAFQPDLLQFGDETGFLSYKMVGRTAYVLGDPIAPKERHAGLIDAFVRKKRDVTFWQVSHETAVMLRDRGFGINEFGMLGELDLRAFSFAGPRRRSFRTAANRFKGSHVAEVPLATLDSGQLLAISEGWRKSKVTSRRELGFLVRPVVLADEPGVRKFLLFDPGGKPQGFAFFDPVYADGNVTGYLSYTRRWLPEADPLAAYFLVRAAIEAFRKEGVKTLHLGLSPFHEIHDEEFAAQKIWVVKRAFRFMYTNDQINRWVYPFRSLAKHKDSYDGTSRQSYCAMNRRPALSRVIKLIRACRII